jgi:DNA-directed RNA polymerase subunit beta'
MMEKIGARASMTQIAQMAVAKGLVTDASNRIIPHPIEESLREGLSPISYFISTSGSRKSMADKLFATPQSGYRARRLVMALRDLYITERDCRTEGKTGGAQAVDVEIAADRITGAESTDLADIIVCLHTDKRNS